MNIMDLHWRICCPLVSSLCTFLYNPLTSLDHSLLPVLLLKKQHQSDIWSSHGALFKLWIHPTTSASGAMKRPHPNSKAPAWKVPQGCLPFGRHGVETQATNNYSRISSWCPCEQHLVGCYPFHHLNLLVLLLLSHTAATLFGWHWCLWILKSKVPPSIDYNFSSPTFPPSGLSNRNSNVRSWWTPWAAMATGRRTTTSGCWKNKVLKAMKRT